MRREGGDGAEVARTRMFVTLAVFQLLRGWLKACALEKVFCGWGEAEGTRGAHA